MITIIKLILLLLGVVLGIMFIFSDQKASYLEAALAFNVFYLMLEKK